MIVTFAPPVSAGGRLGGGHEARPTNTSTMNNHIRFSRQDTGMGDVYRAGVSVNGHEYRPELSIDLEHLQVIDERGAVETFDVDDDGIDSAGGEHLTGAWPDEMFDLVIDGIRRTRKAAAI